MLQVRLSLPAFDNGIAFSDPIIIEKADSVSLSKTVSSDSETISFTVPLTDPKIIYVNYLRWWECWDTETNERLNYGPIKDISGTGGESKKVTGPGRSAVLGEFIKSIQTFYYPVNQFFDDLRYENIAAEPRTTTIIDKATSSEYYGLSKRSKDYVIDEQTGFISIGRDTPTQGPIRSDVFWSGISRADHLTVNLGDKYVISKSRILLPWWGGATINSNRNYDWSWAHSNDNNSFVQDYITPIPTYHAMGPSQGGLTIYTGESGFEASQVTISGGSVEAQYWKLNISNTHAWYGSIFEGELADDWEWECGESNVLNGITRFSPTVSGGTIPKTELNPSSDCHASAVELAIYRKVIDRDHIPNLVYHQIQDDNRQITYYHVPKESEMISVGGGTKYEPGGFFRTASFTAASTTVKDEYNNVLYSGASHTLKCPAYSRLLVFSDASTQVTQVDSWISVTDAFSYGGSYSYTDVDRDYATLHFRGVSLKWFATIPTGVTAGQVSIELRSKDNEGVWSNWDTLEDSLTLPTGVNAEKVYEITYESGLLIDETVYELRITNLNGGYVSIDAFAGYWSGSFTVLNQDDSRLHFRIPDEALALYNQNYSFGSIYEFKEGGVFTKGGVGFVGDRVVVYSRLGKNYGLIKLALLQNNPYRIVPIPGGEADGSLVVDLNNTHNISQAVIFDSNDSFTDSNALPWGTYSLTIYKPADPDPIWLDGVGIHETSGLSVKFVNTSHLEMLKNTCEALQLEWDITERGVLIVPRIGTDTDEIYAEGRGTTISIQDDEDASQITTMLVSSGSDIDGLPLTTVVENKVTRALVGRTIQRLYDFRNIGDYFTLIGASRTELLKRREPQKKITVNDAPGPLRVNLGDSFIAKKSDLEIRVRVITITRNQSSSGGTDYSLECIQWPQTL